MPGHDKPGGSIQLENFPVQLTREKNRDQRRPDGHVHTGWRMIGKSHEPSTMVARPTRFSTGTKPTPPCTAGTRLSSESSRLSPSMNTWSEIGRASCRERV